jgi:hypothetical protein
MEFTCNDRFKYNLWVLGHFPEIDIAITEANYSLNILKKKEKSNFLDKDLDDDIIESIKKSEKLDIKKEDDRYIIRRMFKSVCEKRNITPLEEDNSKRNLCSHFVKGECKFKDKCTFSHHPSKYYNFKPYINVTESKDEFIFDYDVLNTTGKNKLIEISKEYGIKINFINNVINIIGKNDYVVNCYKKITLPNIFGIYLPKINLNKENIDTSWIKNVKLFINLPREDDDPLYLNINYCTTISDIEKSNIVNSVEKRKACRYIYNDYSVCNKFKFIKNNEELKCCYSHHPEIINNESDYELLVNYWFREDAVIWILRCSNNDDIEYAEKRCRIVKLIVEKKHGSTNLYNLIMNWIDWVNEKRNDDY